MDKIQEFILIAAVLSYRFLWYDWSRQNQNKLAWPREDWNDTFLASFLVAAISYCERNGKTEWNISKKTSLTNLFLYYSITNLIFWQACHHVVCSQWFVIKLYPFPVTCLKDTSRRASTDEITYLLQFHLQFLHEWKCLVLEVVLQEFQGTLQPTLTTGCLFAWF